MIDLIMDGNAESTAKNRFSTAVTESQTLFESKYKDRYPNLGRMLESNDIREQRTAANTIKLLNNQEIFLNNVRQTLGEATIVSKLGDMAPKIVDVLRVALPNSISNYICDTQPMDRLTGQILVMKPTFTNTGGGVTAGQDVFANQTDGTYASTYYSKALGTGNGSSVTFAGTISEIPIKAGTVEILHDGVKVGYDNGAGGFVNINGGINTSTSTVNYTTTGAISIAYSTAPGASVVVSARFKVDIEASEVNYLREMDLGITVIPVTAKEYPIRLKWSEQARLVAMSTVGADIDDTITNAAGIFLKIEQDRNIINAIRQAAGAYDSNLAFDAASPSNQITRKEHFQDFLINVSKGANSIFAASGRGDITFMICGTSSHVVVENCNAFVKDASATPIGAYVTGFINNTVVIKDPALPAGEVILGFNNTAMVGDTGIVYAPWIPVFFTPTLTTSDLKSSRALLSMYDIVTVNPGYYKRLLVSNV